ncbi:hypothetical protein ACHAWX_005148 [Stephanocyclus meneghinianus]
MNSLSLYRTASGRHYFANRSTGETSWEPPLPPPPPPPYFAPPPPVPLPPTAPSNPGMMQQVQNHQCLNPVFPAPFVHHTSMPMGHAPHFPPPQPIQPIHTLNPTSEPIIPPVAPTTGKVGYHLNASTSTTPGLLVPSIRAMIQAEHAQTSSSSGNGAPLPKIELEGLTAGAIADLCNITTEFRAGTVRIDKGDFAEEGDASSAGNHDSHAVAEGPKAEDVNQYYVPLRPLELPVASRPPHIEAGRVDIRLHSLYSKLNRI